MSLSTRTTKSVQGEVKIGRPSLFSGSISGNESKGQVLRCCLEITNVVYLKFENVNYKFR